MPAKFLVSARKWPRRKWNVLETSRFHDGPRNFLDLPYRKMHLPGMIASSWRVSSKPKSRIYFPSSGAQMLRCVRRMPFHMKKIISASTSFSNQYINVRIIAIDWYLRNMHQDDSAEYQYLKIHFILYSNEHSWFTTIGLTWLMQQEFSHILMTI